MIRLSLAKFLSILLTLILIIGCVSVPVVAENNQSGDARLAVTKFDDFGRVLYGFEPNTTVDKLADQFGEYDVSVVDADGEALSGSSAVTTGMTVTTTYEGNDVNSYVSVIYGDVNGDGKISSSDLLKSKQKVLDLTIVEGAFAKAADVNKDGMLNSFDVLTMNQGIIGLTDIDQGTVYEPVSNDPVKVLTIGDSLTDDDTWRYNFVKNLLGVGANFEMVGTDGSGTLFDEFDDGDKYKGNCGRGGYSIGPDTNNIGNVDRELNAYLSVDYDVVILMIGRNSFVPQLNLGVIQDKVADNYLNLVNNIYLDNPDAVVICATVAPMRPRSANDWYEPSDGAFNGLNPYVPQIVNTFRDKGKHITWVDLLECGLDYNDWPSYDTVHPNASGYKKIADKWFDGAKDYILGANGNGPVEVLAPVADDAVRYADIEDVKTFDFDGEYPVALLSVGNSNVTVYGTKTDSTLDAETDVIYTGKDMKEFAGDKNFYAFEGHFYSINSASGSVYAYASYTDSDNYIAGKISNRGGTVGTTVEVVKCIEGVETVLGTATYNKGYSRIGLRVDGTKVSVGLGMREVLMNVDVGELPNGYTGFGTTGQTLTVNMWRVYTANDQPAKVEVEPYSVSINKGNKDVLDEDGWEMNNCSYPSWSNDLVMAPYGGASFLYKTHKYNGNYYINYKFYNSQGADKIDNENIDNFAVLHLAIDEGKYPQHSPFQSRFSTSIRIKARDKFDPSAGYTVAVEQRVNSKIVFYSAKTYITQFVGDFNVMVYDENGKIDIYCKDSSGNVVQWFDDLEFEISLGYIGFADSYSNLIPKAINILPIDSEEVPAKPEITPVAGVTLSEAEISVEKTLNKKVSATVLGVDGNAASNKRLLWFTEDSSIATVSSGTVTGVSVGETYVVVKTEDGQFVAKCKVNVTEIIPGDDPVITELPELPDTVAQISTMGYNEAWKYSDVVLSGDYQMTVNLSNAYSWHWGKMRFNYVDADNYYEIQYSNENKTTKIIRRLNGTNTTLFNSTTLESVPNALFTITQIGNKLEISRQLPVGGHRVNMVYIEDNTLTYGRIGAQNGNYSDGSRVNNILVMGTLVSATGMELDQTETTMTVGDTTAVKLNAVFTPSLASNQKVTWTSDNTDVVTVDSTGKLTAVAEGSAVITATSEDGSFADTCVVTVLPTVETEKETE